MTQISKEAKTVFAAILKMLKENGDEETNIKINNNKPNSGLMPLCVELVGTGIESAWGTGKLYSFTHYYEQNGDSMKDPEIVYFVVDNRGEGEEGVMDLLGVWPQMFEQSGIFQTYQELITIEDNKLKTFSPRKQRDAAQFTAQWMKNLKWQQNIIPIKQSQKILAPSSAEKSADSSTPETTSTEETISGMHAKFDKLKEAAKELGYNSIAEVIKAGKEEELFKTVKK